MYPSRYNSGMRNLPLRFGLATLLIGFTVCCLGLGVYMNRVHRQQQAVAEIQAWEGAAVFYDFHKSIDIADLGFGNRGFGHQKDAEKGKHWLAKYAGDDFCHNVVRVEISADDVDKAIPVLRTLPHLQRIEVAKYYETHGWLDEQSAEEGERQLQSVIKQLRLEFPDCEVGEVYFHPFVSSSIPVVG